MRDRVMELESTLTEVLDWFGVHTESHKPWHPDTKAMLDRSRRVLEDREEDDGR